MLRGLALMLCLAALLFGAASANAQALKGRHFVPVDGFASNLGRTVLRTADLIAEGTLADRAESKGSVNFRTFVVSRVLWGETEIRDLQISYTDAAFFDLVGTRIAMPLLKISAGRVFEPIGKPIDLRDTSAIKAVEDLIQTDATPRTIHERANSVKDVLLAHLLLGGTPARYASVEMIYLVNMHPQVFDRGDYLALTEYAKNADRNTKVDLKTAMRHLIHRVLKRDAEVALSLAAGNASAELAAMRELEAYFVAHPTAFDADDVLRMAECGPLLTERSASNLLTLQAKVDRHVEERKAAIAEVRANRPTGLAAFGNAGLIDESIWKSQPSFQGFKD